MSQKNATGFWNRKTVEAIIQDIVRHEWSSQRPQESTVTFSAEKFCLKKDLGADSLELFQLATSVAVFFELHQVGTEMNLLESPLLSHWVSVVIDARKKYDKTLRFCTSGSTGQPKYITKFLPDLIEEAEYWASVLPNVEKIVGVVPRHHLYGFIFTVLFPSVTQKLYEDIRLSLPTQLNDKADGLTALIGYPDYWRTLIKFGVEFSADFCAITSTAPCPGALEKQLKDNGLLQLWQIYGSSETSGVGWRERGDFPYTLIPYFNSVQDEQTQEWYLERGNKKVTLQDTMNFLSADRFEVLARKDKAVQVGGLNVFPAHIANVLQQISGVQQAVVRLMNSDEGHRLKAFIVPDGAIKDEERLKKEVYDFCEQNLRAVERPKSIKVGDSLPKNAMGKITDWHS